MQGERITASMRNTRHNFYRLVTLKLSSFSYALVLFGFGEVPQQHIVLLNGEPKPGVHQTYTMKLALADEAEKHTLRRKIEEKEVMIREHRKVQDPINQISIQMHAARFNPTI